MTRTVKETQDLVARSLRRRYWAEKRFRAYGVLAVMFGIAFVLFLFATIIGRGASVFRQAYVQLEVFYDPAVLEPNGSLKREDLEAADYQALVRAALKERFPGVEGRKEVRELTRLVSSGASFHLRERVLKETSLIGQREKLWLLASDDVDQIMKGTLSRDTPAEGRALSDAQLKWVDDLVIVTRSRCASTGISSPTAIRASPSRPGWAAR